MVARQYEGGLMDPAIKTMVFTFMVFTFIVNMRSKGLEGVDHESITLVENKFINMFLASTMFIYNKI